MSNSGFNITRLPDGGLQIELGPHGTTDVDLSSGWSAHVVAEIIRQQPSRIIVDASRSIAVASAFFSGVIRIRERCGLAREAIVVRLGSERMRDAARLLGVDQIVTVEGPRRDSAAPPPAN